MEPLPAIGRHVVRASCELDDVIKQIKSIVYKDLSVKAPLIIVMFASLLVLTALHRHARCAHARCWRAGANQRRYRHHR